MVYLSTDWDRKISCFALIPLVLTVSLATNQAPRQAEYSDSISCQDCVSEAPAGCKAAQIVHKQYKHDCAITDNTCMSGTIVELMMRISPHSSFRCACGTRLCNQVLPGKTSVPYHGLVGQPLHKG